MGSKGDGVYDQTIYGFAEKKQRILINIINREGAPLFSSTISFIHQLHENKIKTAIVSSSKNCKMILNKAGIEDLFETRVDGMVLDELGLAGKPRPDMFLEAAKRIHVKPSDTFIVEDALSGVQAGHAGNFGLVIGIDRNGTMEQLFHDNGADIVVRDISELSLSDITARV